MPQVLKVLGQQNPAGNTATTLYTVPAANSAVISTLTIANLSTNGGSFRVAVRPGGATLANSQYIAYDTGIGPNDSVGLTLGMTLAATDIITVSANTSSVTFTAFGTENY